ETPLVQFLGQMFSEEGAADADNEWPAHWGARYRAMISIDVVAMNSQLRDDLYRLTKALAMIVAYKIAHNEDSCPFSSPQVSPMGESMAQTVQDPNIFFLAAVRFDAEYALGVTDTAPSVDDIKIGTITPIT
ncbi:MAG: hypothetical protein KAW17_09745, partial [Candidatus Eisenbacteria sp.]|nr:hypothetical protein [Candidatus Eisenbacteria bacterium]